MAQVYNSELLKGMQNDAKIQISRDRMPDQLAEKIVPTLEVNPELTRKLNLILRGTLNNTTSVTVYTVPSGKTLLIYGATLSFIKDATATTTGITLRITVEDAQNFNQDLLYFPSFTLTAHTGANNISLTHPLELKSGGTITLISVTGNANITANCTIAGILIDNVRA